MVLVDIDEEIHKSIKNYTDKFTVDYPSMKNFIDKTLREKLIQLGYNFDPQFKKEKKSIMK